MIRVRGLGKRLRGQRVLDGLDFDLADGETVVVIGQSGTGKSVFLKHLIGLMRPDAGSVEVDGVEIQQRSERELAPLRRRFGMLFQGAALFDSMTVFENVAFPLRQWRGSTQEEIRRRVCDALALVDLEAAAEKYPAELSGGMRKRAGLARAIAGQPRYMLYDEPTTGLDPVIADSINDLILRLRDTLAVTSVAVTHDMASAFKIASRVAMLHQGRIYYQGTVAETQATDDPVVHQFITGSAHGPLTEG